MLLLHKRNKSIQTKLFELISSSSLFPFNVVLLLRKMFSESLAEISIVIASGFVSFLCCQSLFGSSFRSRCVFSLLLFPFIFIFSISFISSSYWNQFLLSLLLRTNFTRISLTEYRKSIGRSLENIQNTTFDRTHIHFWATVFVSVLSSVVFAFQRTNLK